MSPPLILTIGHSTHLLADFVALLRGHDVTLVADVRTVPRSRHNPQFDRVALPAPLGAAGIGYVHLPALGGLRHARPDSPNTGFRNDSFRGFADYMQTAAFAVALADLVNRAAAPGTALAVMCAEAVPWRCHRSLIADALVAAGGEVVHILGPGERRPHALTPFARVSDGRVTYPPAQPTLPGVG
jgi:uncharacterized protein (DUF488 family)